MAALLAAMVLAVFLPVTGHDFVLLDDEEYVYGNPNISGGLTAGAVAWAFTSIGYAANWHPLTWLSHILDVQLYGLDPRGHHLTSLLLHAAAALAALAVIASMTGRIWPSFAVAALFAVHPLRVESVAWVAERKDVLSGLLWMAGLGAYVAYARRPAWPRYFLTAAVLALGLMAKPVVVTLPLVMLMLDYWPLGRLGPGAPPGGKGFLGHPWREKVPLLVLSLLAGLATLDSQARSGALLPEKLYRWDVRAANAVTSLASYLRMTVYPSGLCCYYPHSGEWPPWPRLAASALLLAAISAAAWAWRRRFPFLAAGWLWYLVTLMPMSGLVQVGEQVMADRYTYLPSLGLLIAAAWAVEGMVGGHARRRLLAAVLLGAALAGLSLGARRQTAYWRDSTSLLSRAEAAAPGNWMALWGLGNVYLKQGDFVGAERKFGELARVNPYDYRAHENMGDVYLATGRFRQAEASFRRALELKPDDVESNAGLGVALMKRWRFAEALPHLARAVEGEPRSVEALFNLALTLESLGRDEEAAARYREVVRLKPGDAEAARRLLEVLGRLGRPAGP